MVILRKPVAGLTARSLQSFVARAKRAVKLPGTVNIVISTDRELRTLNHRFRGKSKPTDVLSFPPVQGMAQDFAGDVAISAAMAARTARRLGHATADEVRILALHGMLHLAGYDHEHDAGEMEREEERLRRRLGLPTGLIERNRAHPPGVRKLLAAERAKSKARGPRGTPSALSIRPAAARRVAASPRRAR